MRRHFHIKNLVLSLATFGLGVAAASLLAPSPVTRTRQELVPDIRFRSEICVAGNHSGSEMFHTERERLLMDRIRETEIELVELMRRNKINSPTAERKAGVRQRRLELRLQMLMAQSDEEEFLRRMRFHLRNLPGSTKLIYREHCYER